MKLWQNLVSLLHTLAYGWVSSLRYVLAMLCELHKRTPKRPPEHRPPAKSPCVPIDHPAFVRPDPMIYSQRALVDQGLAVTWDNPDVTLFEGGVLVSSATLEPGRTYDVQARIWNNSLEAPVIRMPVHLSYLDFGIGTEPIPIASGKVDIGVKGSASQPAFVSIPWTTPTTPGHYCLQVQLDPADDTDMSNNLGQENTDVGAAHSPATFTFTLRNNTKHERAYRFETDGYAIPQRPLCGDRREDQSVLLDRHRRERHPVPAGFAVQIAPLNPTITPGAAVTVTVTVEPPAGFLGRQAINVNAFHGQGFAGGVTLTTVKEA